MLSTAQKSLTNSVGLVTLQYCFLQPNYRPIRHYETRRRTLPLGLLRLHHPFDRHRLSGMECVAANPESPAAASRSEFSQGKLPSIKHPTLSAVKAGATPTTC